MKDVSKHRRPRAAATNAARRPAADQCVGCTFNTGHVLELGYLYSRDVTFAVFCEGPFDASNRYREFMGLEMP